MEYLLIIVIGFVFFLTTFLCNNILSAQGDTKSFRNVLIVGFFLNFFLNSLFVFGGIGVPGWMIVDVEMFVDLGWRSW